MSAPPSPQRSAHPQRRQIQLGGSVMYVTTTSTQEELDSAVSIAHERIEALSGVIADSHERLLFALLSLSADLLVTQNKLAALREGTQEKVGHLLEAIEGFERRHQR